MNFDLSDEQSEILNGLERLCNQVATQARQDGSIGAWAGDFDAQLADSGFLDIVSAGFGLLEGALVVERLARLPVAAEAAASVLIAPASGLDLPRPFALASGSISAPARFLPIAKTLLVDEGGRWLALEVVDGAVEPIETLFAYPYGKLKTPEICKVTEIAAPVGDFHRRWRIAIAVESAGLMRGAIDIVKEHVTLRQAFGRPLGSFQAIQHRLVQAAEIAEGARWLAFKAAFSDDEADAAIAATYVQDGIPRLCNDLHQFCGAMGLTLEFPLHYYTYRLRALLGELGGSSRQAIMVADNVDHE